MTDDKTPPNFKIIEKTRPAPKAGINADLQVTPERGD